MTAWVLILATLYADGAVSGIATEDECRALYTKISGRPGTRAKCYEYRIAQR